MKKSKIFIRYRGLGFLQILTLIFITLKLTNYINWSWFWVLSPLIIPIGIVATFLIIAFIVILIHEFNKK